MASTANNLGGIRLAGTVVWCNPPRKVVTTERVGGKGAPKQTIENINYYSDLIIQFCLGPMSLLKLEANADVILDFTGTGVTGVYDSGETDPVQQYNKAPTSDANGVISGTMQGGGGAAFVIYPGNYDQLPDADYQANVGAANAPAFRGRFCIKIKNFNLSKYSGVPVFFATVVHQEINTIAKLAMHLAERVGIEPGDLDLSPISKIAGVGGYGQNYGYAYGKKRTTGSEAYMRGLAEMNRYSPRSALEKASLPHAVAFYESVAGKLTAKYLGGAIDVTIDPNHLGAVEGMNLFTDGEVPNLLNFTLVDGVQTHREVTVNAFDPNNAYESSGQTAYLMAAPDAEGGMTVDLPMTLTADETRRTAERLLYQEQQARELASASLPPRYGYHDPATLAQVTDDDGTVHRLRIQKSSNVLPGIVEIEAVRDNAEVYIQTISGQASAGYPSTSQTVQIPQNTTLLLLDTVTLRDSDDQPIVYVAACPSSSEGAWSGCAVMRDKGDGYELLGSITSVATIGTAATALGNAPATLWDEANTVDVDLILNHTLSSATESAVLNGANAALLGNATDGWEIIQFRNATQPDAVNHPKRWRLSGLLRGRRGSDFSLNLHGTDDYFVLLNTAILPIELDLMERGIAENWKGVTSGQEAANVTAQGFTWQAVNLKPLSVVQIAGSRDGSNNLTLTWVRRTRIGGEWQDLIDAPLSEASEEYSIDVIVNSVVVRTISATSQTAAYSAANQTSDGITPGNPVTVRIYQLSARVGRGFEATATV
jgi:hypothetical protein